MKPFDSFIESRTRDIARRTGRRNFLGRLGLILVGDRPFPCFQSHGRPRNPNPTLESQHPPKTSKGRKETQRAVNTGGTARSTDLSVPAVAAARSRVRLVPK